MSLEKKSFLSGLLYVSLAVIGPIGFLLLPEQFNVANVNDFVTTHTGLVVLWTFVDFVIIGIEVVLTIWLLQLFNTYDKKLSMIAFIFRMVMIVVMIVNMIFLVIVLVNTNAEASIYISYHLDGTYVWQLFFSVHVFLLGFMLYKHQVSRWKYLGLVLIMGSLGYLVDSIISLGHLDISLLNVVSSLLLVFVTIGEIGMAVGLMMKKVITDKKVS